MKAIRILGFICTFFWASDAMLAQKLYNLENINTIEITFKDENWQEMLELLKLEGKKRLEADLVLNGVSYKSVGVRYKGNSSYFNPRSKGIEKLPFNIKSDYKIEDQKFDGKYDRIKLSNVFADPSFIREVLAYKIAGVYSYAPKANFAKLVINGQDFGIYTNTQSVNDVFLEEYFGSAEGAFLKCDKADKKIEVAAQCGKSYFSSLKYIGKDSSCYFNYYELKSDKGWADFIALCKILNKNPEQIETILDVDKTLWMHAFNFVLVNLDSYAGRLCHNYYMYQSANGLFTPIIWDLNLAFGVFKFPGGGPKLSNTDLTELSIFTHYKDQNKDFPLITNLLSNKLYRDIYVDHVHTILTEYFESGLYYKEATKIHELLKPYVQEDSMKLYSDELFEANLDTTVVIEDFGAVIGVKELMDKRTEYLLSKPYFKQERPILSDNKLIKNGGEHTLSVASENTKLVYLVYREDKSTPFNRIEMKTGEEGNFTVTMEFQKGTEYYFIASNGKAVSHFPKKASYELFVVD